MRCFVLWLMMLGVAFAQDASPTPEVTPQASPVDSSTPAGSSTPEATAAPDLSTMLGSADVWKKSPEDFADLLRTLRFQWTSAAKDGMRSASPSLALAKRPVSEVLLRVQGGKLAAATVVYYSRGSSAELGQKAFEAELAGITQELTALTGVQPVERGRDSSSAVKAEGRMWVTGTSQYLLEWSFTRGSQVQMIPFRAEFIRLTVTPKSTQVRAIGETVSTLSAARQAVKKFIGADHVTKAAGGDVMLKDVPMVDQGQRGYCVVASVERVMGYYGAAVDQDELAQIADSDATRGTSVSAMAASLNKLTARLGVKMRSIYAWNYQEFMEVMGEYNRAAKRGKTAPEVPIMGQMIDMSAVMHMVRPDLFKEVRMKKAADFGKFQREIERSIEAGVPLLWSVELGLIPEEGLSPKAFGGHMRLIIGYNDTTHEIIYTDSWGMGHEEKRMPVEDAWTITMGLFELQPIGT